MEISPILMAKMLFIAFLFGIQSGVAFDVGRTFRALFFGDIKNEKIKKMQAVKLPFSGRALCKKEKRATRYIKNTVIFFFDFFWVIYLCIGLMNINYSYNNGGIRIFTIFGVLGGFCIYYFTVSKIVFFIMELLSFSLRFCFFMLFDTVSFPFFKIYNNLVKKIKKRCEKMRLDIEKKRKKVYNVSEVVYKNTDAENNHVRVKILFKKNQKKGSGENEEK